MNFKKRKRKKRISKEKLFKEKLKGKVTTTS